MRTNRGAGRGDPVSDDRLVPFGSAGRRPAADDLAAGPDADPESVARAILLDQLTGRARPAQRAGATLRQRRVPDEVARRLLDRFVDVGLIDDGAFARAGSSPASRRGVGQAGAGQRAAAQGRRRRGRRRGGRRDRSGRRGGVRPRTGPQEAAARCGCRPDHLATRRLVGMLARKGYPPGVAFSVVKDELGRSTGTRSSDAGPRGAWGVDVEPLGRVDHDGAIERQPLHRRAPSPPGPVDLRDSTDRRARRATTATRATARPRSGRSARSSPTCRSGCSPAGHAGSRRRCCSCCRAWTPRARAARCGTPSAWSTRRACGSPRSRRRPRRSSPTTSCGGSARPSPGRGQIGVFDRSHYEDVLIVRVRDLAPSRARSTPLRRDQRLRGRAVRAGTTLVKCMLHISPHEQRARLLARLDDPTKHWKFNPGDIAERAPVGRLPRGVRDRLERTNTERRRGTSSRRTGSGTATSPSGACSSRPSPAGPAVATGGLRRRGRAATSCSRRRSHLTMPDRSRSSVASPRCARAAAARHRRGRRPRHLRVKFRGAGQGVRVLVAEVIVGGLAQRTRSGTRGWWCWTATPRSRGTRPTRRCRTCSTPAPGPNLGVDFLPGPSATPTRPTARGPGRRRGCSGSTPSPPTSTGAGATPTCCAGTATCGDRPRRGSVLPPCLGGGITGPGRAAQPWDATDHVLRPARRWSPSTPWPGPGSVARRSPRLLADVPTPGWSRCRGRLAGALRAAYVDFLDARLATRQWLPLERRHDAGPPLPVRRAALRAARRPRGVRQRRRGGLLPGAPTSSRPPGTSTATAARPRPAASTSTRCARRWRSSTASAPATARGQAGAPADRHPVRVRLGAAQHRRPARTGHGGVTDDPARQLELLLDRLVG